MDQWEIHVGGSDSRGQCLVPVADDKHHVRGEALKLVSEFQDAQADGLRHSGGY